MSPSECGFGTTTRSRSVIEFPQGKGLPCPVLVESQECLKACGKITSRSFIVIVEYCSCSVVVVVAAGVHLVLW